MKSAVLIMVALGCGLVAAVGVFQHMDSATGVPAIQTKQVVIASKEININEPFDEENVQIAEWPAGQVPQSAIVELEQLENKYARTRLYPGEAVLEGKIMGINDASSSLKVPLGFRVVSVKVTADSSVSNLIEPGDRVDVIAVLRETRENPTAMAKTILRGVRVFAVNSEISRTVDREKSPDAARTVSLLVKPEQVERVAMATEMGEIKLSLRSPEDAKVDDTLGCNVDQILGRASVADDLTEQGNLDVVSITRPHFVEEPVDPNKPYWSMVIQTPGTVQKFNWASRNAMPVLEVAEDEVKKDEPSDDEPVQDPFSVFDEPEE